MGPVVLLLVIVVASLVCIRAGAVALELTGMDREKARFQALSAFTNTGFTTRDAEEVVNFPVRRKITAAMIVLGHAGTVSVIATFATTLLQREPLQTAENIGVIVVSLYIIYRLAVWRGLTQAMRRRFQSWLMKRYHFEVPKLEEMLRVGEGFGVMRVVIGDDSLIAGRTLAELGLQKRKVQILSIVRGGQTIGVPQGHDCLLPGDSVICYGDIQMAEQLLGHGAVAKS